MTGPIQLAPPVALNFYDGKLVLRRVFRGGPETTARPRAHRGTASLVARSASMAHPVVEIRWA
jgi:hypothetical protein